MTRLSAFFVLASTVASLVAHADHPPTGWEPVHKEMMKLVMAGQIDKAMVKHFYEGPLKSLLDNVSPADRATTTREMSDSMKSEGRLHRHYTYRSECVSEDYCSVIEIVVTDREPKPILARYYRFPASNQWGLHGISLELSITSLHGWPFGVPGK